MNRAVKIILALSIAILFPIVVALIVYNLYSNAANDLDNRPYVSYPNTEVCNKKQTTTQNGKTSTTTTVDQACRAKLENDYQQAVAKENADYEKNLNALDKITENRIIIALIAALLGFVLAFVSFKYTPIATGLSAGSMIILIASSTFYAGIIDVSGATIVLLYLACFVILIAMFVFADKYFPESPQTESLQKTNNTDLKKQTNEPTGPQANK
jgi:hypothetical protein